MSYNNENMGQITFKIPEKDMKFLKYVSEKTGSPASSLYREKT